MKIYTTSHIDWENMLLSTASDVPPEYKPDWFYGIQKTVVKKQVEEQPTEIAIPPIHVREIDL